MSIYDCNREGDAANLLAFTMLGPVVMTGFVVIELTLSRMFSCTLAVMLMSLTLVSQNINNIVIKIPHPCERGGMM